MIKTNWWPSTSFGEYIVKVISVVTDGTTAADSGLGPIVLSDIIPDPANPAQAYDTAPILQEIKPKLANVITDSVKTQIVDQAFATNTFGLRYDVTTREWRVITNQNLDTVSKFSQGKTGDVSNQNLDASWLLYFKTDGEKYTITYRAIKICFWKW